MTTGVVLEDGTVVDANKRDDQRVNLQARRADGSLLLAVKLTPEQVDDLVAALWSSRKLEQAA